MAGADAVSAALAGKADPVRVRWSILILCLGLVSMVPAMPVSAAAQTGATGPQVGEDVDTFLSGLSPAQQVAIMQATDGLNSNDWNAFQLVLMDLVPDALGAVLARLEAMRPPDVIAFRRELASTDRTLWPERVEVAGASPEARRAHALSLVEAQLLPGEQSEIAAFLARLTASQSAALLEVTNRLIGFGERGLLVTFLARMEPGSQVAMIDLIAQMTAAERVAFAIELHDNGYENWSLLPALRAKASAFEVLRIMFGFLPCRPIDAGALQRCNLPEGSEAFMTRWRTTTLQSRHPAPGSEALEPPPEAAAMPQRVGGLAGAPDADPALDSLFAHPPRGVYKDDRLTLQVVIAGLGSEDERSRFKAFLLDLTEEELASFLAFVRTMPAKEVAAAFHQVSPSAWTLLPRFLVQARAGFAYRVLSGYIPCGDGSQEGEPICDTPEGLQDFLAIWPIRPVIANWQGYAASGIVAKPSDARWQAQIFKFGPSADRAAADQASWERGLFGRPLVDFEWLQVCGGVYIQRGWILTAAHCTGPPHADDPPEAFLKNRRVRLGTIDIGSPGGSEWRIDGVVQHGDFDPKRIDRGYDIALLHIAGPVVRQRDGPQTFEPLPIRMPGPQDPPLTSGASVALTGWGVTGVAAKTRQTRSNDNKPQVPAQMLQLARLQFWQPDYCNRDPRFAGKGYKVGPGQICAGSLGNQSACYLDSGGPLVRYQTAPEAEGRAGGPVLVSPVRVGPVRVGSVRVGPVLVGPVLVGLVSFGIGCGNARSLSGFVDVRFFDDWIKRAKARYKRGKFVVMR